MIFSSAIFEHFNPANLMILKDFYQVI